MKTPTDAPTRRVRVTVNGTPLVREVECRKHLVDFVHLAEPLRTPGKVSFSMRP